MRRDEKMKRNMLPAIFLVCVTACTGKHEPINADPVKAGAAGSAGSGAQVDASIGDADVEEAPEAQCPSGLPGPQMALVAGPKGTRYCIDTTEVTQAHYKKFVDTVGADLALLSKVPECSFQTTFDVIVKPDDSGGAYGCPGGVYEPATKGDQPMECVTWCSAYAYCLWAGKRLCGRIGGGALADAETAFKDPQQSQWYNACSVGGKYTYQYGNTYDATCASPSPQPVTVQQAGCSAKEPGYSSITGMCSGVAEWQDGCMKSDCCIETDCAIAGGSYTSINNDPSSGAAALRCDRGGLGVRGLMGPGIGFRCCLDVD